MNGWEPRGTEPTFVFSFDREKEGENGVGSAASNELFEFGGREAQAAIIGSAVEKCTRRNLVLLAGLLMARDEERRIEVTLKSLRQFCDALIFLDTGSRDSTISIVRSFCQRTKWPFIVAERPMDDFEHSRNYLVNTVARGKSVFQFLADANDEISGGFNLRCLCAAHLLNGRGEFGPALESGRLDPFLKQKTPPAALWTREHLEGTAFGKFAGKNNRQRSAASSNGNTNNGSSGAFCGTQEWNAESEKGDCSGNQGNTPQSTEFGSFCSASSTSTSTSTSPTSSSTVKNEEDSKAEGEVGTSASPLRRAIVKEIDIERFERLLPHVYLIEVKYKTEKGAVSEPMQRLVRSNASWRYSGPVHEVVWNDVWRAATKFTIPSRFCSITQNKVADGRKSASRWPTDLILFEERLRSDPTHPRALYYKAKTLKALGRIPEAVDAFRARCDESVLADGADDENFNALLGLAESLVALFLSPKKETEHRPVSTLNSFSADTHAPSTLSNSSLPVREKSEENNPFSSACAEETNVSSNNNNDNTKVQSDNVNRPENPSNACAQTGNERANVSNNSDRNEDSVAQPTSSLPLFPSSLSCLTSLSMASANSGFVNGEIETTCWRAFELSARAEPLVLLTNFFDYDGRYYHALMTAYLAARLPYPLEAGSVQADVYNDVRFAVLARALSRFGCLHEASEILEWRNAQFGDGGRAAPECQKLAVDISQNPALQKFREPTHRLAPLPLRLQVSSGRHRRE